MNTDLFEQGYKKDFDKIIQRHSDMGFHLSSKIICDTDITSTVSEKWFGERSYGICDFEDNIYVDPNLIHMDSHLQDDWLSVPRSISAAIAHELGHVQHIHTLRLMGLKSSEFCNAVVHPLKLKYQWHQPENISQYAQTNYVEFVAEVHALVLFGLPCPIWALDVWSSAVKDGKLP